MTHPPIHIPTAVLDAERELLRLEREGASAADERYAGAHRRQWRAWEAWGDELRRQVRQVVREAEAAEEGA